MLIFGHSGDINEAIGAKAQFGKPPVRDAEIEISQ